MELYIVTHKVTGKSYVGITTRCATRRWNEHKVKSSIRTGPFYNALKKYGLSHSRRRRP